MEYWSGGRNLYSNTPLLQYSNPPYRQSPLPQKTPIILTVHEGIWKEQLEWLELATL
jgi:hypothetical protein